MMGKVISQLAEVLEEIVAERARARGFIQVPELRKGAVSVVAARYSVHPNTISDGFIRRLRPDIASTGEFDGAVEDWLNGSPDRLRTALLRRIGSAEDAARVFRVIDGPGGK